MITCHYFASYRSAKSGLATSNSRRLKVSALSLCVWSQSSCSTGREIKLWADELTRLPEAPFQTGPDTLFVAYYAVGRIGLLPRPRLAASGADSRSVL